VCGTDVILTLLKQTLFSYSVQLLKDCAEISIAFLLLGFLTNISMSRKTNTKPLAAKGSNISALEMWIPARGNFQQPLKSQFALMPDQPEC
jgi:hypothetical protein